MSDDTILPFGKRSRKPSMPKTRMRAHCYLTWNMDNMQFKLANDNNEQPPMDPLVRREVDESLQRVISALQTEANYIAELSPDDRVQEVSVEVQEIMERLEERRYRL